jgi:hypothetical protein
LWITYREIGYSRSSCENQVSPLPKFVYSNEEQYMKNGTSKLVSLHPNEKMYIYGKGMDHLVFICYLPK